MLVAEYVAKRTGKKLDFGDWDGDSDGKPWARKVRALLESRDVEAVEAEHDIVRLEMQVDAELPIENAGKMEANTTVTSKNMKEIQNSTDEHDSDDSLTGYASDGDSSRSPSPTPSELAEIEKDPMLNVGKKKVAKPVYLADLGGMLRSTAKPDDPQEADRIEVAITCAEELIRKKKGFGLELEENAVNLVYGLLALNNNFELDDFDAKRQGALNALVACCPQRAPPAIIEEFFKNQYSTEQRFAMLNALALGARELASLPIPPSTVPKERTAFPSRRLPPALHQKYLPDSAEDSGGRVRALVDDISQLAIDKGKEATEDKVPAFVRERQLRIKQPSRINEISLRNQELSARNTPKRETTFTDVAAEYFLGPLVARFWLFLRDEQTREARTAHRTHSYRGTGTGLILNPMVLAQLLGTTTVLVHAARHAPAFLAVLAPDALELALTLGTRPLSTAEEDKEREAAVLTACLELAVVVIDACLELDGGRSLGLEHTALVVGSGEWAGEVLGLLDKGARVQGGGGVQEVKLKRAAAGVVIKVDELTSRWRPSMISVG
ncbi:hypothetical protein BD410DRAFT_645182 [Rickenella mellea]|uniref:Telomere length regulation protein conserved domain-containing protein n=1 Tax=Rickenella mellea TaxID=50990 RepID=A0A4Y7PM41_9AGAM|nr:hypothetical protein BD410DRAFT_645182 [Rickenella mellea]